MDTVISAPPKLYSCAQNRPSAASETPGRAHPGASGPFPPATDTLGILWPAGLAGGDVRGSPAAVPQATDAISVWVSSGLRESCGPAGDFGDPFRHQRDGIGCWGVLRGRVCLPVRPCHGEKLLTRSRKKSKKLPSYRRPGLKKFITCTSSYTCKFM